MTHPRTRLGLAMGLTLGLGGCQHFTPPAQWTGGLFATHHRVMVTSVPINASQPESQTAEDALYERAAAAIDQRDYGLALDVLQLARQFKENDPRVLTAMGVVYDKLGRFDLSKRFYDLAEAADPGSKVVAIDRSYSLVLQRREDAERAPDAIELAETPPMSRRVIASEAVRATGPAPNGLAQRQFSGGVHIVNTTGTPDGANAIRARLVEKDWHVIRVVTSVRSVDPITRIRFPPVARRVSNGLARTLPFPVKLQECPDCVAVELFVGADALPKLNPSEPTKVLRG